MEQKETKLKNLIHGITFGLFITTLIFFTFGCDKKKSGGGTAYGNYGYGQPGYGGSGKIARSGYAMETNGRYTIALGAAVTNLDNYNVYATVSGDLHVRYPIRCEGSIGNLGINPGLYKLVPVQTPNTYLQMYSLTGMQLKIQGTNLNVVVTLPLTEFTQYNTCGREGMYGYLNFETLNGYPCGTYTEFNDSVPANMCAR